MNDLFWLFGGRSLLHLVGSLLHFLVVVLLLMAVLLPLFDWTMRLLAGLVLLFLVRNWWHRKRGR